MQSLQGIILINMSPVASTKGEAEPERKETRNKVDEDRKHEYPFQHHHSVVTKSNFVMQIVYGGCACTLFWVHEVASAYVYMLLRAL